MFDRPVLSHPATVDKARRRANWPGMQSVLRQHAKAYVSKHDKALTRKYYVDGQWPEGLFCRTSPDFLTRALLEPESGPEEWEVWWNTLPRIEQRLALDGLMRLQEVDSLYFGWNSPFSFREKPLFDFLFERRAVPVDRGGSDAVDFGLELALPLRGMKAAGSMSVNPNCQAWRRTEIFHADAPSHRDRNVTLEPDDSRLVRVICAAAWAERRPELFHDTAVLAAAHVCEALMGESANPHVGDMAEKVLDRELERYATQSAAGGQVEVCLSYPTAEGLEAMLPLLDPTTRYPYAPDQPEGLLMSLPELAGRSYRASNGLVRGLWKTGFAAESFDVLDERTLTVRFTAPLRGSELLRIITLLSFDATDLETRLKARPALPEDDTSSTGGARYARFAYRITPALGPPRVGWTESDGRSPTYEIEVSDQNVPIDVEKLEEAAEVFFEAFDRGGRPIREFGAEPRFYLDWL